ncbi:transglutaminaseTgpA domain-containing protein [Anaeromonas frigoriresistens]|uniref:transglutaminaseTgpA domain-containing protein n=1 Tax=Anaeromonas frigoriresistens TaxID=2683708 RepID=UPI003314A673
MLGFFYRLFLTFIINFTIIKISTDAIGDTISLTHISLISISTFIFILIFYIVDKKPITLIILMSLGLIVSLIANRYYNQVYRSYINELEDFSFWVIKYINYDIAINLKYFNFFIVLFTMVLSLFIYIIVFKFKRVYPLLILGTAYFLYRWFLYQDTALTYYYVFILSVLLLYVYNRYKYNELEWQMNKKDYSNYNIKSLFIYSILTSVIIILIAFILPKDNPPITWRWMDNKVQDTFPEVTEWRNNLKKSRGYGNSLKFDLSYTQYQKEEKRLGGDIKLKNTLVMEVESDRPLYLKGRVSNKYTGFFWKSEDDNVSRQLKDSTIDIRDMDTNSYSEVTYKIKYNNMTTSTIFNSYVPIKVDYDDDYYVSDEYEIYTNKVILKDKGYTVKSRIPYFDTSKLDAKYDKEERFQEYLKLPNSVPSATHDLSFDITKNAKNDYEKMMMLQNHLRENYEYTLTPGNNGYNDDFVNHFLFETKKGYCTYFASALAVMGRSVDVPTRYVEGFITGDEKEDGTYKVYSKYAHAWVEAYISGYGWMIFEATPAYQTPDYQEKEEVEDDSIAEDDGNDSQPNDGLAGQRMREDLFEDELMGEVGEIDTRGSNKIRNRSNGFYIVSILLIIAFLLLIYLIYRIIITTIKNRRIKKLTTSEKIVVYHMKINRLLSFLGYDKELGETDLEYVDRISLNGELNNELYRFINVYMKSVYGNKEISFEEQVTGKRLIEKLENEVKNKKGTLKLLVYKYII